MVQKRDGYVEIFHNINNAQHGEQYLEVERYANTVVWQDMPFWEGDLIRWSLAQGAGGVRIHRTPADA